MRYYHTAHVPVLTKTGRWGDAANGRKLVDEDAINGNIRYTSQRMEYINQHLKERIYSYTVHADDTKYVFTVWCSDHINKHGLVWKKEFLAIFTPFSGQVYFEGAHDINFWLSSNGYSCFSQTILSRDALAPSIRKEILSLWKCKEQGVVLPDDPLQLLVMWRDGSLAEKFRLLKDKGARIKKMHFGVELEFTGISRDAAARTLAKCLNTHKRYEGGVYHKHLVFDQKQRVWQIMSDSSIVPSDSRNRPDRDLNNYKCELVTPILCFEDIPLLQKIVCAFNSRGAVTNRSCGIHVHVDVKDYTALALRNLVNICCAKEHLLKQALQVLPERDHWCQDADEAFVLAINQNSKNLTMNFIQVLWYGGSELDACFASQMHYDPTRYHLLNLHSLWQQHGVEFRCFNSSLDNTRIRAYIVLALAICEQARGQQKTTYKKCQGRSGPRAQMQAWMQQMGLTGDEFKDVRHCLTQYLTTCPNTLAA